jgi:hypothetical protein
LFHNLILLFLLTEGETVIVAVNAFKVNRSDLKKVERTLIITDKGISSLEKGKPKARVPLENVSGFSVSTKKDNVLVIHCENEKKGDMWFVIPDPVTLVEIFVRTQRTMEKVLKKKPTLKVSESISSSNGKTNGTLGFEDAPVPELVFRKEGKDGAICTIPNGSAPTASS